MKTKWKHIIREAHRQWARKMANTGVMVRCRMLDPHWSEFTRAHQHQWVVK